MCTPWWVYPAPPQFWKEVMQSQTGTFHPYLFQIYHDLINKQWGYTVLVIFHLPCPPFLKIQYEKSLKFQKKDKEMELECRQPTFFFFLPFSIQRHNKSTLTKFCQIFDWFVPKGKNVKNVASWIKLFYRSIIWRIDIPIASQSHAADLCRKLKLYHRLLFQVIPHHHWGQKVKYLQ